MAGNAVYTEKTFGSVKKVKIDWTSDTAGNVSAAGNTVNAFEGAIVAVGFMPAGGANSPSNNYSVQVLDGDGFDVLGNQGAGRNNAVNQFVATGLGAVASSKLSILVSGAGNTKQGNVLLYIR